MSNTFVTDQLQSIKNIRDEAAVSTRISCTQFASNFQLLSQINEAVICSIFYYDTNRRGKNYSTPPPGKLSFTALPMRYYYSFLHRSQVAHLINHSAERPVIALKRINRCASCHGDNSVSVFLSSIERTRSPLSRNFSCTRNDDERSNLADHSGNPRGCC